MGIICILLGVISFLGFIVAGALSSNKVYEWIQIAANTFQDWSSITPMQVYVAVIGVFAFIGLLIALNLIMHGLTYNKVTKIHNMMKRR